MGTDKSFLRYRGSPFVRLVSSEMMEISDDVIVVIGDKATEDYAPLLDGHARVARDAYDFRTPLAGLATGFELAKHAYSVAVACDTPLVGHTLMEHLFERARGHSAAIPVWRGLDRLEPLVSVYNSREAREAAQDAIGRGRLRCLDMISFLRDVAYVDVAELKQVDRDLRSFLNINSKDDYSALLRQS